MAVDFVAGCFGGIAGVAVGHPFDTVKVRIQTQDGKNKLYKGVFHCFYKIVVNEKVSGLYKGVSSPMAGLSLVNAIVFGVYGNAQRLMPNPDSITSHFVAGSVAGFCQTFICSPMELAKTQLQMQGMGNTTKKKSKMRHIIQAKYTGPVDCLRQLYMRDGIRGPFKGLSITLCREIPSLGIYFSSYEYMNRTFFPDPESANPLVIMTTGGLSGICSWVFTYPTDVVKSRFQADGHDGHKKYKNVRDCIVKSYKEEGLAVFSRGLNSTIIRAFPTNAATFFAVSYVTRLIMFEMHQEIPESEVEILFEKTGATLLW